MDGVAYEDVSTQLEPGDRFFIYSDGIIEQPRPGDGALYKDSRLTSFLTSHAQQPGDRLVEQAVDALAQWAGARRFVDDVSLVAVEWRG